MSYKEKIAKRAAAEIEAGQIITTTHTTRDGKPKILEHCDFPLTAKGCVNTIITELAVMDVIEEGRLSYFPGISYSEICRQIEQAVEQAVRGDSWLAENQPEIEFYGFRSDGHSISRELPALRTLNDSHQALTGQAAAAHIAACTTDLRAFIHFGTGQATCYGPVAENIHAANERVNLDSVTQVA